jgi:hypothetical protein
VAGCVGPASICALHAHAVVGLATGCADPGGPIAAAVAVDAADLHRHYADKELLKVGICSSSRTDKTVHWHLSASKRGSCLDRGGTMLL